MLAAKQLLENMRDVNEDPIYQLKMRGIWPPNVLTLMFQAIVFMIIKSCSAECPGIYFRLTPEAKHLYLLDEDKCFFKPLDRCPVCGY